MSIMPHPTRILGALRVALSVATLLVAAAFGREARAVAPFAPTPAPADVQVEPPRREVYEGTPFRVQVHIRNAQDFNSPTVPEIPGAQVRISVLGTSQSQIIRNGQRTRTVTVTYGIDITPERAGELKLPTITVHADGVDREFPLGTVDVLRSESTDVFEAEVFGTPPEVFIGQPLELVLRIAIKPYRDPVHGQLNEVQMWQFMDREASEWGEFLPTMQRLAREQRDMPMVQQEQRNGSVWYVYEVSRTIWPPKAGAPDVGGVMLRMRYPVALREERGFLGTQLVPETRPVSAAARVNPLTVLALPEKGRPAGFTGAVGLFSVAATARPDRVAVGDPVTLTLVVTDRTNGEANLDTLQPPVLSDEVALRKDFRIPTEPLSGTVKGRTKTFVQTIRPLRADVREVPPIAFSFFDPSARAYRTVTTEAIPIEVRPASEMDLSRIERAGGSDRPEVETPGTQLTAVEGGLTANRPVTPALLANTRPSFSTAVLLALAVPPVVVGAASAWRLHRRRHEQDAGLARRSRARRTAERRLQSATDAAAVARAVAGFVEDRLGRAEGTMTRGDLRQALEAQGLADGGPAEAVHVLEACDRAVYGAGMAGAELEALRARAARALDALDRASWKVAKGAKS